jgi:hypothetical protein
MRVVTVAAAVALAVLGGLVVVTARADDRGPAQVPRAPTPAVVAPPPVLGVVGTPSRRGPARWAGAVSR